MLFMAGVFNSYTSASLFIALTGSPLVRHIFRQEPDPQDRFYIHGHLFEFLDVEDDEDIYSYEISRDSFKMTFAIYGIDTDNNCAPLQISILCNLSGYTTNVSILPSIVCPYFATTIPRYPSYYV